MNPKEDLTLDMLLNFIIINKDTNMAEIKEKDCLI